MSPEIYTRVIVIKNGQYLVGHRMFGGLNWSTSPWDAWWTRTPEDALKVALRVGGQRVLFNPVIGKTKIFEEEKSNEGNTESGDPAVCAGKRVDHAGGGDGGAGRDAAGGEDQRPGEARPQV